MSDKAATNIFGVLDNELQRMHNLFLLALQRKEFSLEKSSLGDVYAQIKTLQDVVMEVAKTHDPVLQEKIAEMALTGKVDVDKG